MAETIINQETCWRKHDTWNRADGVLLDSVNLTDKQKHAIRQGHTIRQGNWTFSAVKMPNVTAPSKTDTKDETPQTNEVTA